MTDFKSQNSNNVDKYSRRCSLEVSSYKNSELNHAWTALRAISLKTNLKRGTKSWHITYKRHDLTFKQLMGFEKSWRFQNARMMMNCSAFGSVSLTSLQHTSFHWMLDAALLYKLRVIISFLLLFDIFMNVYIHSRLQLEMFFRRFFNKFGSCAWNLSMSSADDAFARHSRGVEAVLQINYAKGTSKYKTMKWWDMSRTILTCVHHNRLPLGQDVHMREKLQP